MTIVDLAGFTFHGTEQPGGWHFADLVGWYDLPPSKNRNEQRPQAHGSFATGEVYRDAAVPGIRAWYRGASRADAVAARRALIGALAVRRQVIGVTDELGRTTRDVVVQRVEPSAIIGSRFDVSIDAYAPDPRRYYAERTATTGPPVAGGGLLWNPTWPLVWEPGGSDGRLTVENPGTADTYASLHVTGGVAEGFSLVEVGTGRELRFERPVPVGSTVTIDQRTGRATLDVDTNDVGAWLTRFDWFPVGPGQLQQILFTPLGATTGTPTLTARWRPADW